MQLSVPKVSDLVPKPLVPVTNEQDDVPEQFKSAPFPGDEVLSINEFTHFNFA